MMKQPADNLNATRDEVEATQARAIPIPRESPSITEEVAQLAYKFWQERNGGDGFPEEDWFRAEEIVRNRVKATGTA